MHSSTAPFRLLYVLILLLTLGGSIVAQKVAPKTKKEKVGFFDGGKKVVDYIYDDYKYKYNGSYAVRQGNYWGLLSDEGEELIPCKYDTLRYNWGNEGYIVSMGGQYGIVTQLDSTLLSFDYDNIDHYYHDSIALIKQTGKWGYLVGPDARMVFDTAIVFKRPQQMPLFDACSEAGADYDEIKKCSDVKMLTFVYGQINYPRKAMKDGIQGMVVIGFTVAADGEIRDAKIKRDIGGGCGEEALRVIEKMDNWQPGLQDGVPVATRFVFPVKYKL